MIFGCKDKPKPEKSVVVASAPVGGAVGGVTIDPAGAYFATTEGLKWLKAQGPPATVGSPEGVDGSSSVAAEGDRLFFTHAYDVYSIAKAGGPLHRYTDKESYYTRGVVVDEDSVYWGVEGKSQGSGSRPTPARLAQIRKAPREGGAPLTLASFKHLWKVGLVQDESYLYFAGAEGLYRVAKAGGEPERLLAVEDEVTSLSVDEAGLYFTLVTFAVGGGDIRRVPKEGGPVEVLVPGAEALAVATHASGLYWLTEKTLASLPRGASAPVVLDRHLNLDEAQLAIDEAAVYWSDGHRLWRTAR